MKFPQMKPIFWLNLFIYFSFIILLFIVMNFYIFFYKLKNFFINNNIKFYSNWKW